MWITWNIGPSGLRSVCISILCVYKDEGRNNGLINYIDNKA
jgi:hypothetical protein